MTIVAANWVGENTSTLGTGPLALSGAISTFCTFSVLPDGSEVYYTLQEGFNRETGIGVVSNGTLTRNVQATLVAGVYTETDIPISLSGNGQVFAVINADFMTRIYNFSLDVADSVAAAAASAQAAADYAALANDYKTQSAQNAEDAAASALSASDSKVAADASKTAAASSADSAANSQADALASKNAAAASETNSKSSENASAQYATNASNSAAAALASQNAAKTSEDNALASKTAAEQSAIAAKDSENNAKTSETNAKASETSANSANTNAQTAKSQTESLYNQAVNLVAGVQAPDKLPGTSTETSSWMKIANLKRTSGAFAFAQFIVGGGSDYSNANLPVDLFSISGRGLPATLSSSNIDTNFTQIGLQPNMGDESKRVKIGVVQLEDDSFDVYLFANTRYAPPMWINRINIQPGDNLITGPIIDHTSFSWITTEPTGIVYNNPIKYLRSNDSTIPRTNVANTFSQPQVISSTLRVNGASDLRGGVDVTSTQKMPLKETTATNGIGVNFIVDNATECSFGIENTSGGTAVFHNYTRGANNAASSNGQLIGGYGSRPWDGSAYTEHSNVSQHFLQDGTCSATNHGGWFRLLTTPLNATMDNRRQTFATSNNGDLWIGYDVPMGTYKMEGISSGGSEPLSWNGRGLKQINNSSNELNLITPRNGSNSSTVIRGNSCNGTLSSRGSSQFGDAFHVGFGGHDGNDWVGLKASIRFSTSEGFSATATGAGITFSTTAVGTTNRVDRWNISNAGVMYPVADNAYSIGNSSMRVSAVYAANGAIQTSDARLKSEVRKFTDNEIAAAKLLSQEIGIYSWLAKQVAEGENAREHIGLTVQRAIEIMESCGLNPMHYGFICHDEWEEEDIIIGYEDDVTPIMGKKEAGDRYSFRYDQLNLFIAMGIEARLSALEDKLGM